MSVLQGLGIENRLFQFVIAFLLLLALIGVIVFLIRALGSRALGGGVLGRHPRLGVLEAAAVDTRRRLVLVRRDNVEHLLLIGGPSDIVIESGILRSAAEHGEAQRIEMQMQRAEAQASRASPRVDAGGAAPREDSPGDILAAPTSGRAGGRAAGPEERGPAAPVAPPRESRPAAPAQPAAR